MPEEMKPEGQAIQDKRDAVSELARLNRRRSRRRVGCLMAFLGAIVGVVLGGYVGAAIAPPRDPSGWDFHVLAWIFWGAVIGCFAGSVLALVIGWAGSALRERWRGRSFSP